VQQDLASVGARVGWVQLANIAGNAAGSVGSELVTLHLLGTAGTLRLLAALSLALLLGWLWRAGAARRRAEVALGAACGLLLVALPGNAALWRRLHAERPGQAVAWGEDRSGIAFFRDDNRPGEGPHGPFFIQGFSQGRIPFLPIHQFLGAVGPLLHPNPQRVLAIGVGSGGTPWAAGVLPATREVRAVELVAPVLTTLQGVAAAHPHGPVAEMLRNPRWRLEYGDGRRALARGAERYDVIQADAILPEGSHSGLLYSREFLLQVRRRLAAGGIYVQWAPTRRVGGDLRQRLPARGAAAARRRAGRRRAADHARPRGAGAALRRPRRGGASAARQRGLRRLAPDVRRPAAGLVPRHAAPGGVAQRRVPTRRVLPQQPDRRLRHGARAAAA
jgi:spermidine synthase